MDMESLHIRGEYHILRDLIACMNIFQIHVLNLYILRSLVGMS
jgi:hypothetical protein